MNDYHDTPGGVDVPEAVEAAAAQMRDDHRTDTRSLEEIAAEFYPNMMGFGFGGRRPETSRNWAVLNWARGLARMFDMNRSRAAAAAHLSREASRHSTAPEPKSVDYLMTVYARQRGTSPTRLRPNLTPAQARRLRKKRNRMKGTVPA